MRNVCGCRHFCIFEIICELLQPFRKILQTVVRISIAIHSFYFVFVLGFWDGDPLQFPEARPSLRSWAVLVGDKSYKVDVEDELLPEVADNAGTTRGTNLFVLRVVFFLLSQPWSSQSFPSDRTARRVIEYLHRHEEIKIANIYLYFLICLHYSSTATPPLWGSWIRRVSISSKLNPFAQHVHQI